MRVAFGFGGRIHDMIFWSAGAKSAKMNPGVIHDTERQRQRQQTHVCRKNNIRHKSARYKKAQSYWPYFEQAAAAH